MKELDLLVERYFTPALGVTDIIRLVEQVMTEATIRPSRVYYYVRSDKVPNYIIAALSGIEELELEDRLYVTQELVSDDDVRFTFYLADSVNRNDIYIANRTKSPTPSMKGAVDIGTYERKVQLAKTKITWLQTKPPELRAENEHLGLIKEKFNQAGISPESPATIYVNGKKIDNVAGIDKISSKNAVGDFALIDSDGSPLFTMSHKALGFERYAALVSTMKSLGRRNKTAASRFVKQSEVKWKRDVFSGKRSSKGYYQLVTDEEIASQLVYLIYGMGGSAADSLFIGEISLVQRGENGNFDMGVEQIGQTAVYLRPELPDVEEYLPIFRTRYGSGGSKVGFNANDVVNLNSVIQSGKLTLEDLDKMGVLYEIDEFGAIENVSLPVRYYISPFSRNDGAEDIEFKRFHE